MKSPTLKQLRESSERENRRFPGWVRYAVILASLFLVWVVLGFFLVPVILRSQLEKRASALLNRPVHVGKVAFNPLTLSLTVQSLDVAERDASGVFLKWERLFVDFEWLSFLWQEWRFQQIALDGFELNIALDADGRPNFADLLPTAGRESDREESWPLAVKRLVVSEARLRYTDQSQSAPFQTDVGPMSFALAGFYTGGPKRAPGEFSATTESGETIAWRGTVSLAPLRSTGNITLGQISLKKYAPYYTDLVRVDVLNGTGDAALQYQVGLESTGLQARVLSGQLGLRGLQLARRGETEPLVSLGQLDIAGVSADLATKTATLGRVLLAGGEVKLRREPTGIDLVQLLVPGQDQLAAKPRSSNSPKAKPNVSVGEFSIRDLAVEVEDSTGPRLARHRVNQLTLDLQNFSTADLAAARPIGIRAKLAPNGEVHLAGTVAIAPLQADLAVELNRVALSNVSPYLESQLNLRIAKGLVTSAARVHAEIPENGPLKLSFQGEFSVDDFSALDGVAAEELASWRSLAVKGIDFNTSPAELLINEVEWVDPAGRLIVRADGSTNLSAVLQRPQENSAAVTLPSSPARRRDSQGSAMFIAVERLALQNAALEYLDRSVQPNVQLSLGQLTGSIDGLSSSELARAAVDLRAKMSGVAPVTISGQVNPLSAQAFTDLRVAFRNVELVPFGPYVGKYAGYELARGSLTLDVRWKVAQRKVDSANVATLDQFTFGKPTNSPDATRLPVTLAVALLRDRAGRIVLDLPVRGSLDDPKFRVGRVVLRVIENLLTKAATSPFALLGAAFGGGAGEELGFQQFAPGQTSISEEELKKLAVVAKALRERPMLRVEVAGSYDEAQDGPVLRERALEDEMRDMIWNDRRQFEPDLTFDEVTLSPEQKLGMVRRLFYRTFPKEAPKRTAVASAPAEETSRAPIPGQRGNLGSFQRRSSRPSPPPPAPTGGAMPFEQTENEAGKPAETPEEIPVQKALTLAEMKSRLMERVSVDAESFRQLALARAQAVREYLVTTGEVPADRVFLGNETAAAGGTKATLQLK